jgi:hypothetical protein
MSDRLSWREFVAYLSGTVLVPRRPLVALIGGLRTTAASAAAKLRRPLRGLRAGNFGYTKTVALPVFTFMSGGTSGILTELHTIRSTMNSRNFGNKPQCAPDHRTCCPTSCSSDARLNAQRQAHELRPQTPESAMAKRKSAAKREQINTQEATTNTRNQLWASLV